MNKEKKQSTHTNQTQEESSIAVLGVSAGEDRYLIPMYEVSEVISAPKLAHVPLTQPWFLGLANVRGNLYGITDLGVYLGGSSLPFNLKSRILLAAASSVLSGFIVNNMLGIRSLAEFTPMKLPKKTKLPRGIIAHYKDTDGREWRELSLLELIQDEKFLQIARD